MLKIVGGKFRGRKIQVPKGNAVRPTLNKTREAVFNVLQNLVMLPEVTVLDLFAGSGALGLEALSRGAKASFFVESSSQVFPILWKNVQALQLPKDQAVVVKRTARSWLPDFPAQEKPCLIFIDPPYESLEYAPTLDLIGQLPNIPQQSILVVESPQRLEYALGEHFMPLQTKHYGRTKLDFLVKC